MNIFTQKVLVRNAPNTKVLLPPFPYKSWRAYWEAYSGYKLDPIFASNKCLHCGESFYRYQIDGCHVYKVLDSTKKLYIIPCCDGCNHKDDVFFVDENKLVPAQIGRAHV